MEICAIISEYNPFHNGHFYQIAQTKNVLSKSHAIVAVMSGNFVQRGEPALYEKYARAKCAVLSGADLVIELPLIYAVSSAEYFAKGAIDAISKLGICTHLSFGSEHGQIDVMFNIAKTLKDPSFHNSVKNYLNTGVTYAVARQKALEQISPYYADIISQPNNILGIEYIKAMLSSDLNLIPITIKRFGVSHDSSDFSDNITSASNIRDIIRNKGINAVKNFIPQPVYETLSNLPLVTTEKMEHDILCQMRRLSLSDISKLPDISEGIENRFLDACNNSSSIEEIYSKVKTKRYTLSRIRRMLMHAYLGITADMYTFDTEYLKILAFNDTGRALLKKIKTTSSVPLITKPSANLELSLASQKLFDLDILATDLYNLSTLDSSLYKAKAEMRKTPFYNKTNI